jgi:hypothetical protein
VMEWNPCCSIDNLMGNASHDSRRQLVLNFQKGRGMWIKKNYMKLVEEEEGGQFFFWECGRS